MQFKDSLTSARVAKELKQLSVENLHKQKSLEVPVVVSLTSIPSRFDLIHLTVRSVLSGSAVPIKVILWLHESHQESIPDNLSNVVGERFEIRFDSKDSPHLKLVRSLQEFPNNIIVTCDDDLMYGRHWLASLYEDHLTYPNDILAHECRAIAVDEKGHALPYRYWYRESSRGISYPALLPLGFGGVLYPKGCFNKEVCSEDVYMKLAPKADDLWFKAMSTLRGTESRSTTKAHSKPVSILSSQKVNLRDQNISQDRNRSQWSALAEHYTDLSFLPFAISDFYRAAEDKSTNPVDAVITWVDGDDPVHQEKMSASLAELGIARPASAAPTRYKDCGELSYSVMSLLKFAPWIRKIYIVTDNQKPDLLNWIANTPFKDRVLLVDHRTVFSGMEDLLPVFNTRSISANLWRIPDLAEHFIYLNDDFFITKPVDKSDFFRDGKVVIRGEWKSSAKFYKFRSRLKKVLAAMIGASPKLKRPGFVAAQILSAKLAGFDCRYYQLLHNPHPMKVSTLERFAKQRPDLVKSQSSFKFRSLDQYVVESLAAHLEIAADNVIFDNRLNTLQLNPQKISRKRIKWMLKKSSKNNAQAFACVQNIDKASEQKRHLIFSWLLGRIGTF